jgi:UDP-N-acetylglucosamine:LPS N-acetylglucosamine transferase
MRRRAPTKIALVSSVGGHLTELLCLRDAYEAHPHFYVFNDRTQFTPPPGVNVYTIAHAERDPRVLSNVLEVLRIFRRERPTVMLTTGAGPGVSAAVAARLLGMRVVFVESVAAVERPSLTGVLMELLADAYFVQWPELAQRQENPERWKSNVFGCS